MILYIGSRRYSSWSLRASLMLEIAGLKVREVVIPFVNEPDRRAFDCCTRRRIRAVSPSGRVPVLHIGDGGVVIHDSLAIGEYANERSNGMLLPSRAEDRAMARAIACELHAEFHELRRRMPLCCGSKPRMSATAATGPLCEDIERIEMIISSGHFGAGPFLFGRPGLVDAMIAPYVLRLTQYRYPVLATTRRYAATLETLTGLRKWVRIGSVEPPLIPEIEALVTDYPNVASQELKL